MLEAGRKNKAQWEDEWAEEEDHYSKMPDWLRERITEHQVVVYAARQRTTYTLVDLEQFRYRPTPGS